MQPPVTAPGRPRRNKKRRGIVPVIDMTPMVDLGFLLISFFVITTELTKPVAMDLVVPKDGKPMPLGESYSLTLIPSLDNQLYYYFGDGDAALEANQIFATDYSPAGLRSLITKKQSELDANPGHEGRGGLMVVIKPGPGSSYRNVVDILDEMSITRVKKFALDTPGVPDVKWIEGIKD